MPITDRVISVKDYKSNYNNPDNTVNSEDAEVVYTSNTKPIDKDKYPDKIRERIKSIKDFSYGSNLVDKSKYSARGMFMGAMFGTSYALYKRKNLLAGAFFGSVFGVFGGYMVGEYLTLNKNDDNN